MKIIDLLNKIANGEEVPKKIRVSGWCYKFTWIEHMANYYDKQEDIDLMSALSMCVDELNKEIEIIEEHKPLNEIRAMHGLPRIENNFTSYKMYADGKEIISIEQIPQENKIPEKLNEDRYIGTDLNVETDMFNKINEIIDYLKSKGE